MSRKLPISVRATLGNLRLRTKFLLSLVLTITALTCATLLVVRQAVQHHVQDQIVRDAKNSVAIFENLRHQHQVMMSRKADLLATQAFLSDNDVATFIDSSENPLDTSGIDLIALANASGKVLALRNGHVNAPQGPIEALLRTSAREGRDADWWLYDGRLYQVDLQPIRGIASLGTQSGTVIVGQEIDEHTLQDLGRLSSSEIAIQYEKRIVASTLSPFQERQLLSQFSNDSPPNQIQIASRGYFSTSLKLNSTAKGGTNLIVLKSDSDMLALLDRLNQLLLGLGLIAVLAGGFFVFLISNTFIAPLMNLTHGVKALERGNFDYALKAHGGDEVASLTRAFDRMRSTLKNNATEKQLLEDELRQSQKMDALGRLAGGVAHDFNNLLTIIKGHSDLLLDWLSTTDAPYKSSLQINKASDRAASLTRQLLAFSRRQDLEPKLLELNAMVIETNKLLERLIREDIEFVFQPDLQLARVKADPGQIEQVLLNLTVNACDAMPHGGKLTIETSNVSVSADYVRMRPTLQPGEYVLLSVLDTGVGMDERTKSRIFEPFFTTKEKGKGTGLGLATVYGAVRQSGGFIWVESAPGSGTRFEIYLPQIVEPCEADSPDRSVTPAQNKATILVVEDEPAVRELACHFLTAAGYHALAAKDGEDALELSRTSRQKIAGLLTDVVMPKMRGTELARRLNQLIPGIKIIYMSGYLGHNDEDDELLEHGLFLQKPFTRDTLLEKVSESFQPRTPPKPRSTIPS